MCNEYHVLNNSFSSRVIWVSLFNCFEDGKQRHDQRNFHETSEIFSNNKPFQCYFRQRIILWRNALQNLWRNVLQNITNKYRHKIQQLDEGIPF